MKTRGLLLAGLLFMFGFAICVSAQTSTRTFTPNDRAECAPFNSAAEPQCYYPIVGTAQDGTVRWLTYNTTPGTIDIIEFNGGYTEIVEAGGIDLNITFTPILNYSIPAGPLWGQWLTKVAYREMKGTFNEGDGTVGAVDLLFENFCQYKPWGRIGRTWVCAVYVVNEIVDATGKPVAGYGPSYVNY